MGVVMCFGVAISSLNAQESAIRGHVYDEKTGEPIIYANIVIGDTNFGTNTDENGYFYITDVPVGTYRLKVSYIGYEELSREVEFRKGKINYYKVSLILFT